MEDYVKVLDHWSWLLLFWFCPFFCRLCVVFHCTPYNVAFVVYNTLKSRVHKQITREEKNRYQILLKFFLIGHAMWQKVYFIIILLLYLYFNHHHLPPNQLWSYLFRGRFFAYFTNVRTTGDSVNGVEWLSRGFWWIDRVVRIGH